MIFGGHIVYLLPNKHHLRQSVARVQMMLKEGPQINNMPDKSHVIIIIINIPGQMIQFFKI